jgi:hypothetical protein
MRSTDVHGVISRGLKQLSTALQKVLGRHEAMSQRRVVLG